MNRIQCVIVCVGMACSGCGGGGSGETTGPSASGDGVFAMTDAAGGDWGADVVVDSVGRIVVAGQSDVSFGGP